MTARDVSTKELRPRSRSGRDALEVDDDVRAFELSIGIDDYYDSELPVKVTRRKLADRRPDDSPFESFELRAQSRDLLFRRITAPIGLLAAQRFFLTAPIGRNHAITAWPPQTRQLGASHRDQMLMLADVLLGTQGLKPPRAV